MKVKRKPQPEPVAAKLASKILGGILCSKCWKLLARPEQVEYEEWRDPGACWCTTCTPPEVPTRLLLSVHGQALGNVQHRIQKTA